LKKNDLKTMEELVDNYKFDIEIYKNNIEELENKKIENEKLIETLELETSDNKLQIDELNVRF
jgi:hypothetical protein